MKILVCVKQVPDDFEKVHLGADQKPDTAKIAKVVNAFDTYAVEMAVRYVEANGGEVTILSLGDEQEVRPAVVQMISVGATKGIIAANPVADADEYVIASELKEAIEKSGESFDLILCGKESTDKIGSVVASLLAEKLNMGYVSGVVDIEALETGIKAKQETEEGSVVYELALPAVLSIAKPAYDPRYPNLKSKMAARKAVIPFIADITAEKPVIETVSYSEPEARKGGLKIEEKEVADTIAKAFAILDERKVI